MRNFRVLLSVVLFSLTANANALVIYTDRAEWEAAVGTFTTDTYNEVLEDQSFVTLDRGDYILDGSAANPDSDILIDVASYESSPEDPILSTTPRVNLRGITDSFFITFDSQINAFGFDIINYDNGGDVGSIALDGVFAALFPEDDAPEISFFGFTGQWVTQIEILADERSTYHAFDNVSFAVTDTTDVPAPMGVFLLSLGLIGLGLRKRK